MIPGIKGGSEEQKDLTPPSGSIGFWHVKGHLMNTKKGRMPIARKRRANLAAGASADIGRGKTEQGKDANYTLSYPKKNIASDFLKEIPGIPSAQNLQFGSVYPI